MAVISAERVHKRFRTVTAVDDLTFEVRGGEVFALLGPNGAGKTTTVRLLLGLIRPDAGSIRWQLDGGEGLPDPRLVGYLPEDRGLYRDQPVLRTLTYFGVLRGLPRRDAHAAALGWLERLGLVDRAGDKLEALSKGNQQKVQLAAAVLHGPAVAVLDEPFSGLDPLNQELFVELIQKLRAAGTTIVLSAHQMDLVERLADRLLLIARGREVLHGTLAEIRRQGGAGVRLAFELAGAAGPTNGMPDLGALPGVVEARHEGRRFTLLLAPHANLNAVLAHVAALAPVTAIHTERVTLHDIYVRAVRKAGLPDNATEEDAS